VNKKVLITGSAGFIGFHLTKALLASGLEVVGVDNINSYYDPQIKMSRLDHIDKFVVDHGIVNYYRFIKLDISNEKSLSALFQEYDFDFVINLAAQAGVRYSLENPRAYVDSNLVGFTNVLECCRHAKIEHLLFASSSSVYGMNSKQPFSVTDNTDYPISLYAATKKSNELLAYSYSHLFNIPCTGLRFFTVYGPYGRPDMAYYSFTKAISEGMPINVFNSGVMKRDFTYIDDVVEGILRLLDLKPASEANEITDAKAPYRVLNVGNNDPITLRRFISAIENAVGRKAIENLLPMQAGDVMITYADIDPLSELCDFQPNTSIEDGIDKFVDWYRIQGD
jgi:UDP-glucuronate 4-epimerase